MCAGAAEQGTRLLVGLGDGGAAACGPDPRGGAGYGVGLLLRLCIRAPVGVWTFVSCEYCMLSGRCICDELTTCPEESYRLWCVIVCDQKTSKTRGAKARHRAVENTTTMGCKARKTNKHVQLLKTIFVSSLCIKMCFK